MSGASIENDEINKISDDRGYKLKAAAFISVVAGFSMIGGFGTAIATAKKQDPISFKKGFNIAQPSFAVRGPLEISESGSSLALRALGWGTLYAVTGCSMFFYALWKFSGATDLKDFRMKVGKMLPVVPKNNPPQSRTEFSGLNDLLTYVSTEKFGQGPVSNKEPEKKD